jgi:hypothetical protein
MLLAYSILAFAPLAIILVYVVYKFAIKRFVDAYLKRSRIAKVIDSSAAIIDNSDESLIHDIGDEIDDIAEKTMSSVEEAKMLIFHSIYKAYTLTIDLLKTAWHHLMHYFVILMRLLRDFSDWVYVKSRDRFVETAAKERKSVRRFWKHLKEYKKESDQEE